MGLRNSEGKIISYECSGLIAELKEDIAEFGGDKVVAVWCKEYEGVIIYTNYDFIEDEMLLSKSEIKGGEFIKKMTMSALLVILKKQNEAI